MRRRALLISLIAIAVLGFYTGRTVLPGVCGYGTDPAAVPTTSTSGELASRPAVAAGYPVSGSASTSPESTPESAEGSQATLWVDVDISDQLVKVMRRDESVRTMTASTGAEGHETPLGTFEIQNRGEWFFNEKYGQGAKYWVSFKDWGIYLFHSLAMDRDRKVIPDEADKLGTPASHGCVSLAIEDAKWLYDNIPEKAKVVIHD